MTKFIANIGGTFIFSKQPEKLVQWYEKVLGINTQYHAKYKCHCTEFTYFDNDSKKNRRIVWAIIKTDKRPQIEGDIFTINYRVNNMEEMLAHLKANQIEYEPVEQHAEGRFTWILDPDCNRVELWQDVD